MQDLPTALAIRRAMHDVPGMRTTVEIDEDVLQAARELARNRKTTLGKVLSELARRGLRLPPHGTSGILNGASVARLTVIPA